MSSTLLLLRHAKSSWREPMDSDFERRLSGRGVRDGSDFGKRLAAQLPKPDFVLCSAARRTRDTLAFLIPELVDPRHVCFEEALYHASATTLLHRIQDVPAEVSTLLVIAHNPGLTNLMNHLLGSHRNAIEHLPTFGCAHFTLSGALSELEAGNARLTELLRPRGEPQGDP